MQSKSLGNGNKIYNSVKVFNDSPEYNLYGVVDNLEIINNKEGDYINRCGEKSSINIVEFKPTKPKNKDYNYEDFMQVFAQKICVDYMFSCNSRAEIYYSNINRRVKLPVEDEYMERKEELKLLLSTIRKHILKGKIPSIKINQNCNGCSMFDLCMPKHRNKYNLLDEIKKIDIKEKEILEGDSL